MSIRILPFRQYDENDVINLFALNSTYVNESTTGSSNGDAGVFVTVDTADFNADPVTYAADSYLGKTDYPFVGRNQYPSVSLKCKPATSGDALLGITLRQTAKNDENGEKLLYYPQKAEELMAVLPVKLFQLLLAVFSLSQIQLTMVLLPLVVALSFLLALAEQ